jgi:hypothetical protein
MKIIILAIFFLFSLHTKSQDKNNFIEYSNNLIEVLRTDYIIATVSNKSKLETKNKYLLFINTKNGNKNQVEFPKDSWIGEIKQINIKALGFNKIIVVARTVNLDGSKKIDWGDPKQIFILSTDGETKVQVTEDNYFVRAWVVNEKNLTLVTTGYYDSNNNGKYDKKDKNSILIYDLETLKLKVFTE